VERCLLNSKWNTARDRGILKGGLPPGRKYDFLVPSSYFFRSHKAPRVESKETTEWQVEEGDEIAPREERRELCSGNSACKSRKSRNFPCVTRMFVRRRRLNAAFIESVNQVWQINCRFLAMARTSDENSGCEQSILFRDINSENKYICRNKLKCVRFADF